MRLAHFVHIGRAVLLSQVVGTDAGCLTVSVSKIPVVQCLIVLSFHSQHMQQVATEDVAVGAFHKGRLIAFGRLV